MSLTILRRRIGKMGAVSGAAFKELVRRHACCTRWGKGVRQLCPLKMIDGRLLGSWVGTEKSDPFARFRARPSVTIRRRASLFP